MHNKSKTSNKKEYVLAEVLRIVARVLLVGWFGVAR